METNKHQRPENCHVCGRAPHAPTSHVFWSNADARAEAQEHDRRASFAYSDGSTTVEAHYVNSVRPY